MFGMGVRVSNTLTWCWVTSGFVSAGNEGDNRDRISTTLRCLTKCLKSFGYGILIHFVVAMQL